FCFSLAYEYRISNLSDYAWITWILCFIADDLTYYWFHRISHQVRFLWASHMVHHSAEHLSLSAAFRQPWTSHISGTFLFWIWMPFLGFTPAMVIFMKSVNVIYQFGLHTEMIRRLPGWIEFIFNTPAHHRVHHASNLEYLDKNHGGVLIIWDRLFGTYQPEIKKPIYGLTKNIPSQNPIVITFYEWRKIYKDLSSAKGWRECFHYLFNVPGWSVKTLSNNGRLSLFNCTKAGKTNDPGCKKCKGCTFVGKDLDSLNTAPSHLQLNTPGSGVQSNFSRD
ncbi:MAG TPA: sterol desaturase family protein, partial [Agriterribacter sp.]|nr:sterol desaturase family protein [Agriterribacter sp.]